MSIFISKLEVVEEFYKKYNFNHLFKNIENNNIILDKKNYLLSNFLIFRKNFILHKEDKKKPKKKNNKSKMNLILEIILKVDFLKFFLENSKIEKVSSLRNTFNKIKSEIKKNLKSIFQNLKNYTKNDLLINNPILSLFLQSLNFLITKNLEIFKTYHILNELKDCLFLLMNNMSFFENSKDYTNLLINSFSSLYLIINKDPENIFFEISKNIEFQFFYLYDKKMVSEDLKLKINGDKKFEKKINFIKNQINLDPLLLDYDLIFYKIDNFSLKILLKINEKILSSLQNTFLNLKDNFEIFLKILKFFLQEKKTKNIKKTLSSQNFYSLLKITIKFLSKINYLNTVYNSELLSLLNTSKITIENPSFSFLIIKLYKTKFKNSNNLYLQNYISEIKAIFQIGEKIINYLTKPKIEGFYVNRRAKENVEYNLNDIRNNLFGSEIFLLEKKKLLKICKAILKVVLLVIVKFEHLEHFNKKFLECFFSFCMSVIKNATVFENLEDFLQKEILKILKKLEMFRKQIDKRNFLVFQNNLYSFLKYNGFENIIIKSNFSKKPKNQIAYEFNFSKSQKSLDLKNSPKISFANFHPENYKNTNLLNSEKSEILPNEEFKFERAYSDNVGISRSLNERNNGDDLKKETIGGFLEDKKSNFDIGMDDISSFPKVNLS